jgi:hypothetical protein
MNGVHRMIWMPLRLTLAPLADAAGIVTDVSLAQAQVQRQSSAVVSAQLDPNAVRAVIDPLKIEVEALRVEVNRLHAALESLRLTVTANHAEYAKHRHGVAYYGVVTAKTIYPHAPADILLAFTAPGVKKSGLTEPPE